MLSQRSVLIIHDIVLNLIQQLLIINPVEKNQIILILYNHTAFLEECEENEYKHICTDKSTTF